MLAFTDTSAGLREYSVVNGKPIQILRGPMEHALELRDGDRYSIYASCYNLKGVKLAEKLIDGEAKGPTRIDTVAFFVIDDDLGFRHAACVAFGESKEHADS